MNAMMTTRNAISIPGGGATLSFDLAYAIEEGWDFLWVQVSADNGTHMDHADECAHLMHPQRRMDRGLFGFPSDLCGANIGGFTGTSSAYPGYATETFSLNAFAGQNIPSAILVHDRLEYPVGKDLL